MESKTGVEQTQACAAIGIPYGREIPGGFVPAVTQMLQAGRDLATIGSITGHKDKTLILHMDAPKTESRDKAMDVPEDLAGSETLGFALDTIQKDALIYSGM